ncbi:hypothetical protein [Nocardia thailandica]
MAPSTVTDPPGRADSVCLRSSTTYFGTIAASVVGVVDPSAPPRGTPNTTRVPPLAIRSAVGCAASEELRVPARPVGGGAAFAAVSRVTRTAPPAAARPTTLTGAGVGEAVSAPTATAPVSTIAPAATIGASSLTTSATRSVSFRAYSTAARPDPVTGTAIVAIRSRTRRGPTRAS